MSIYLNAFLMLTITVAAFVLLARSLQKIRSGSFTAPWRHAETFRTSTTSARLAIEQTCIVDSKRRLLLIRCDKQHVLLLTGGPVDTVIHMQPQPAQQEVAQ